MPHSQNTIRSMLLRLHAFFSIVMIEWVHRGCKSDLSEKGPRCAVDINHLQGPPRDRGSISSGPLQITPEDLF